MDSSTPTVPVSASIGRGIFLMLLAVAWFSCMTATVKHLTADYSVFQIIFFRSLVPLPFVLLLLVGRGGFRALQSHRPGLQILRNMIAVISNTCLFLALGYLALSDATAIQFTSPLIITALSALILGDRVGPRRWLAVITGFAVVLMMLSPSGQFHWASLVLLFATFCYGSMVIATRILLRSDSVGVTFFYLTMIGALASAVLMPWVWVTPTLNDLLLLIMVGAFGGLAQLCLVSAVQAAPPAILAPFEYTLMLWAIGFDLLLWQIAPAGTTLLGAAAIAGAGLYVAQRESQFMMVLWQAISRR